jgi:hypothetical protein
MARLGTIEALGDARPYLETMKQTILADVQPLLDLPEEAPFAVNREVFCYVDHLGHLYSARGPGHVGERFQDYLKNVMCKIDPNYSQRASVIYQMCRNRPVHEFAPKVLENKKGQLLKWLCFAGAQNDYNFGECSHIDRRETLKTLM